MLAEKIARVQSLLKKQNIDALIVGNFGHQVSDDLLYWLLLTKLEYGYIVIPKVGRATLHAISFEVEMLQHKRDDIDIVPIKTKTPQFPTNIKTVAYRPSSLTAATLEKLQSIDSISLQILKGDETLWATKLPKEILRIRRATKITDVLFADLIKHWDEFFTEADAANYLLKEMSIRGLQPSFPPIVASGMHAANPHHIPEYKQIQSGFCVIDIGVRYKGYCSDMTRTIFVGTPSSENRRLYQTLLDAQIATTKKVIVGTNVKDISTFCRDYLGEKLNKEFIHALGHGVGSQVHEWPSVNSKGDAILAENMVITIEPGVYKHGAYGIRVEDDVLVTKKGPEILNDTSKDLIVVATRF